MMHECELRRCTQCLTLFEACVADRDADGQPRCPQCGLAASVPAGPVAPQEFIVRPSTPFR